MLKINFKKEGPNQNSFKFFFRNPKLNIFTTLCFYDKYLSLRPTLNLHTIVFKVSSYMRQITTQLKIHLN